MSARYRFCSRSVLRYSRPSPRCRQICPPSLPDRQRRARRLRRLDSPDGCVRGSRFAVIQGDYRLAYVASPQQQGDVGYLQIHGLVGRPGRLAAALGLAALHLLGDRCLHQPPQVPRHDAVVIAIMMSIASLLPGHDHIRREPVPSADGRARHHRRR